MGSVVITVSYLPFHLLHSKYIFFETLSWFLGAAGGI